MRNFITIFRRELGAYFNSTIAYVFLIVFVVFANGLFMINFFQIGKADMRNFFNALPFILNIFIPAISMRLWAEDRRGSTFELLLTFPMQPWELVLGKYLASLVFFASALLSTATIPVMIRFVGQVDPGPIAGGYLGSFFMGALFLAIGIFISGLTKDQIVAFILSVIATFAVYYVGTDFVAATLDGWVPGLGSFVKNNFGMASHVIGFGKGIIDVKDIVYFVAVIFVFLFLNGLSLEGRLRPRAKAVFSTAVLVCLLSVVLLNWLLHDIPMGRYDVTQGKLYTISDTSLRILRNLKVPVAVKLYISPVDSMPTSLKTLEREVADKLEELRIASGNKLRYKVIHLEALSDEKEAESRSLRDEGIVPFQVESIQRDEVGVKLIYSSMTIEYKEKPKEFIPRIVPQTLFDLEYQLLSRVYKMTLEEKPKVAVFAPVTEEALSPEIVKMLAASGERQTDKRVDDEFKTATLLIRNNGYDAERIALTKDSPVPDKTSNFIVLNPGALTDRQRFEINRFLYQGGTAVVGAEPFDFSFDRTEKGIEAVPEKKNLDINKLLEKWGVKISGDVLCDENANIISLTTGQTIGPFAIEMPVKFPNQIVVDESMINRATSLTNRLPSIFYLWGAALDLSEGVLAQNNLKSTILFTSTPESWKVPNDGFTRLTAENTRMPLDKVDGKFPLAVLIEGQFLDAFGGAPAPKWNEEDKEEGKELENPKPGRLLVIGSSKVFSEDLIKNPGNINLFANIIDGLTLQEDLIQIRSKVFFVRDLRRLSNAQKLWYKFFTVLFVPVVLGAFAAARLFLRRKEKEMYVSAFAR